MNKQQSEYLYKKMKADIRDNKLPVGCTLKQEELSHRYQISRSPIRDVLTRLKNEGWLATSGKRGVMVPAFCDKEAEDLYRMRMRLEPMLIPYVVKLISKQTIGQAEDILRKIDSANSLSIDEHGALNWRFHACLYQTAERPTLFKAVAALHEQCGRYIGFHTKNLDYKQTSQDEHYSLLKAIEHGNTSEAQRVLSTHISAAGKIITEYLRVLRQE
ncbi:GntR family transcriptional regulator [Agaribacter flavus]|uniref:GntR family transcriptional regulator n=1 Tax=Agaribacter flavus TaxID=1902781 RepID=A0ABV7FJL2_9ALTE